MTDSTLLKYARARDDADFRWRIAAAMSLKAQAEEKWDLAPASRQLNDWVLANPMVSVERMVAAVATNPAIAADVTLTGGIVDTSAVPDDAIVYTVNQKWDAVAGQLYGESA